jgi:multidrug transporter EmrE-like cation transporter
VAVWAGVGALSGTLLGLLLADARDAFEWTIVGGLSLIVIAAFAADTRRLV